MGQGKLGRVRSLCALTLALGCGADGGGPAIGSTSESMGEATGSASTTETGSSAETHVPVACEARYADPFVQIGSDEPGLHGVSSLAAAGSLVYACTDGAGVVVWDVADAVAPVLVARDVWPDGSGAARCDDLAVGDNQVAVARRADASGNGGVLVVFGLDDGGLPTTPAAGLAGVDIQGVAELEDERWAVAAGTDGVIVVDSGLTELGSFGDEASDARSAATIVDRDRLVVAEGRSGVRIYDVGGDAPVLLGAAGLPGSSVGVHLEGDVVFVSTLDNLAVLDVSSDDPVLIGQAPTPGNALEATTLGALAFVADWEAVTGFDVADPGVPTSVGRERIVAEQPRARAVTRCGEHLCVGAWTGLQVFAVEAPSAPDLRHEPTRVTFQDVDPGQVQEQVLVLRNAGNAPLEICDVVPSLPGVSVEPSAAVLEPGGALPLELTWTAESAAPVAGVLRVLSDDPDQPELEVPFVGNEAGVGIGDPVPAFIHVDAEGRVRSHEDLEGKVALLAYFASWCGACNMHFPDYDDVLWARHSADGFVAFGMGNEPVAKVLTFATNTGTTFPLLLSETTYQGYDDPPGTNYSLQVVVDKQGVIREIGHEDLTAEVLEPLVTTLLAE